MKKTTRVLSGLIAVIILLSALSVSVSAYTERTYQGMKYTKYDSLDGGYRVVAFTGDKKNIEIPSKIKGVKVTSVDVEFKDTYVESLYIPETVKYVNISKMTQLKKIDISEKNKFIKFENNLILNKNRTKVYSCLNSTKYPEIPKSVKTISGYAFAGTQIKKIVIGKNVTKIEQFAFFDCKKLKQVTFNNKLNLIDYSVFQNCKALKTVKIPKSVKIIKGYAFADCINLTNIDLGKVKTIEEFAFSGCKKLTEIKFYKNLKKIKQGAFGDCKSLDTVKLPASLKKIDDMTFANCTSLKSIKIPDNVKSIGAFAFNNCKSLKEIIIPKSVKNINALAFAKCETLERIYIYNPECEIYFEKIDDKININAIQKSTVIYGYKGSTAEKYAKENGNRFIAW